MSSFLPNSEFAADNFLIWLSYDKEVLKLYRMYTKCFVMELKDFILFTAGLPTKEVTSTTTVELLSSLVLTNFVLLSSSLAVFTFAILFLKGHI